MPASSLLDTTVSNIVSVDGVLAELPRRQLGLKHDIELLIRTPLGLGQAEEGPDDAEGGSRKPKEASFSCPEALAIHETGVLSVKGQPTFPVPCERVYHVGLNDVGDNLSQVVDVASENNSLGA